MPPHILIKNTGQMSTQACKEYTIKDYSVWSFIVVFILGMVAGIVLFVLVTNWLLIGDMPLKNS